MEESESIEFTCNICGNTTTELKENLTREKASCFHCKSSIRLRAIAFLLTKVLSIHRVTIDQLPKLKDIKCIDLSGWFKFEKYFGEIVSYKNTFFHKEPKLDINNPAEKWHDSANILISSEVFEHTLPPPSLAFMGAKKVLKPGGSLILTVPFVNKRDYTLEHYPNLHNYIIKKDANDEFVLHNTTRTGELEIFKNLKFHGGPGETLETRVFSRNSLLDELNKAGFVDIEFLDYEVPEFGIIMNGVTWSLPILARASE